MISTYHKHVQKNPKGMQKMFVDILFVFTHYNLKMAHMAFVHYEPKKKNQHLQIFLNKIINSKKFLLEHWKSKSCRIGHLIICSLVRDLKFIVVFLSLKYFKVFKYPFTLPLNFTLKISKLLIFISKEDLTRVRYEYDQHWLAKWLQVYIKKIFFYPHIFHRHLKQIFCMSSVNGCLNKCHKLFVKWY